MLWVLSISYIFTQKMYSINNIIRLRTRRFLEINLELHVVYLCVALNNNFKNTKKLNKSFALPTFKVEPSEYFI